MLCSNHPESSSVCVTNTLSPWRSRLLNWHGYIYHKGMRSALCSYSSLLVSDSITVAYCLHLYFKQRSQIYAFTLFAFCIWLFKIFTTASSHHPLYPTKTLVTEGIIVERSRTHVHALPAFLLLSKPWPCFSYYLIWRHNTRHDRHYNPFHLARRVWQNDTHLPSQKLTRARLVLLC